MRVRLEYFDHNDQFEKVLPIEGTIVSTPDCGDSLLRWHLMRLDSPVLYRSKSYSNILMASRWQGQDIGEPEPTSVFILLVPPTQSTVSSGFSHKIYEHVAWGMAYSLEEP